jgi:two-component SAPR family response regulator
MKIAFCANQEDIDLLKKLTMQYCAECNCRPASDSFESRESLVAAMTKNSYDIVLVAMCKAKGMETVKHVHRMNQNTAIIWFSDDADFAGCAYENNVKQFALLPINSEKLSEGLERCGISTQQANLYRVHIKADEHLL